MGPISVNHTGSFCLDDGMDYLLMDGSLFHGSDHEASDDSSSPPLYHTADELLQAGQGRVYSGDESYVRRRQRNNAAVRRSREKARQRQRDSQRRLAELTAENNRLQLKASVLIKELSLLRGLFPDQAAAAGPPANQQLLSEVDNMLHAAAAAAQ